MRANTRAGPVERLCDGDEAERELFCFSTLVGWAVMKLNMKSDCEHGGFQPLVTERTFCIRILMPPSPCSERLDARACPGTQAKASLIIPPIHPILENRFLCFFVPFVFLFEYTP